MLLVGCVGGDRYRTRLQLPDELQQVRTLPFNIALIFLAQTLRQQPSNADANEPIGQQIALQQVIQAFGRCGGGSGGQTWLDRSCCAHRKLDSV